MRSLQVHVPAGCPNRCPFCCSAAHHNQMDARFPVTPSIFIPRMNYAREHGCDFLMLTSTGEPTMNLEYIHDILAVNQSLRTPFDAIDLQTSGAGLNVGTLEELRAAGVTTIALSVAYLLDDDKNAEIMRTPEKLRYKICTLAHLIRTNGFTLRLCLNLTSEYDADHVHEIFHAARLVGADQVTFKRLYANAAPRNRDEREIRSWVIKNREETKDLSEEIDCYIRTNGRKMSLLPGGEEVYSIQGMSTVLMTDCQGQRITDTPRYYILRPNGKLYTRWDDDGSIVF